MRWDTNVVSTHAPANNTRWGHSCGLFQHGCFARDKSLGTIPSNSPSSFQWLLVYEEVEHPMHTWLFILVKQVAGLVQCTYQTTRSSTLNFYEVTSNLPSSSGVQPLLANRRCRAIVKKNVNFTVVPCTTVSCSGWANNTIQWTCPHAIGLI